MTDNLFFNVSQLKRCGKNVIIGMTVRIRYPELVEIGDNVIIDDFTYISTMLEIEDHVHIAAGCKLIGGRAASIKFSPFSTLAPNVVLAAGSDDYVSGMATPTVPFGYKGLVEVGKIEIGRHCIVGANSVVMPNVRFGNGAALAALSLAKRDLEPWMLYGGIPAKKLKARDQDAIENLEQEFLSSKQHVK